MDNANKLDPGERRATVDGVTSSRIAEARGVLTAACARAGFPPPATWQGLSEWADSAVDVALAPRGSAHWGEATEALFDALQAALLGAADGCETALRRAVAIVKTNGRRACTCAPALATFREGGRDYCVKCLARRQ